VYVISKIVGAFYDMGIIIKSLDMMLVYTVIILENMREWSGRCVALS